MASTETAAENRGALRQELLELLARRSFRLGEFVLSSGATSSYYVDCRLTTLHARGGWLTGQLFLHALSRLSQRPEAVGGLTLGADPIVSSISVQSALTPTPLDAFLVRKSEKKHGTGRRIEGEVRPGMRVAIVDDVCTTAASTIQAVTAAWEAQLEVVAVLCLVEREEAGGRANLESLWRLTRQTACPFSTIFQAGEIRAWLEARA